MSLPPNGDPENVDGLPAVSALPAVVTFQPEHAGTPAVASAGLGTLRAAAQQVNQQEQQPAPSPIPSAAKPGALGAQSPGPPVATLGPGQFQTPRLPVPTPYSSCQRGVDRISDACASVHRPFA